MQPIIFIVHRMSRIVCDLLSMDDAEEPLSPQPPPATSAEDAHKTEEEEVQEKSNSSSPPMSNGRIVTEETVKDEEEKFEDDDGTEQQQSQHQQLDVTAAVEPLTTNPSSTSRQNNELVHMVKALLCINQDGHLLATFWSAGMNGRRGRRVAKKCLKF